MTELFVIVGIVWIIILIVISYIYKRYRFSSYVDVLFIGGKKVGILYKTNVNIKMGEDEYVIENRDGKWGIIKNGKYEDLLTQPELSIEIKKEQKRLNLLNLVILFSGLLIMVLLVFLYNSDEIAKSNNSTSNDTTIQNEYSMEPNKNESNKVDDVVEDIIQKRYKLAESFSCGLQYVICIDSQGGMHEPAANEKPIWFDFEGWNNLVSIAGNGEVIVGLATDGRLYECHNNDGFTISFEGWYDVIQICTGNRFVAGLQNNGKVRVTGRQKEGQYEAENWANISQIATSQRLIVGLDDKNGLHFAGNHSDEFEELYNKELEKNPEEWDGIIKIYASGGFNENELGHVAVLTDKGELLCIGDDFSDAPGNTCIDNVEMVALGDYSIIAIVNNNQKELLVIGEPGTINDNENIYKWGAEIDNIVDIDAGMKTCGALLDSGHLLIAGSTKNGQDDAENWDDVYVLAE